MEKVLVIGPFNEGMKSALADAFPPEFALEYITGREDYGKLADADYCILRTLTLTAQDIAGMGRMKLIQRWGAGYDTVDIQAAAEKRIPVAVCCGINSTPVAELTLALMLAVYRNVVPLTNALQSGAWERESYAKRAHTLSGKTVGVVGIGNIGRKVAALAQAFGARVLYYDAFRLSPEQEDARSVVFCPLEELWGQCDVITLHVPLLDSTVRMVNAETLSRMKDGAVLINTARQELVDLEALAGALRSGKLSGAGLDALEEETMASRPFAGLNNVVLTPHLGGNTADDAAAMAQRCAEQIMAVSRGEALCAPHLVNGVGN